MSIAITAARVITAIAETANHNAIRIVTDIPKKQIMAEIGVTGNLVQEVTIFDTRVIITNDANDDYGKNLPSYEVNTQSVNNEHYAFLVNQNARLSIFTALAATISITLFYIGYFTDIFRDSLFELSVTHLSAFGFMILTCHGLVLMARRHSAVLSMKSALVAVATVDVKSDANV